MFLLMFILKKTTYTISAHRVGWFLYYGKFPELNIDHVDSNTYNNRISNLSEASDSQNLQNRRKSKNPTTSIYKGVRNTGKSWVAQISCNHITYHLGTFSSEIEAAITYDKAAIDLFGEFACLNFSLENYYNE